VSAFLVLLVLIIFLPHFSSLTPSSRHRFDLLCETLSKLNVKFQINYKLGMLTMALSCRLSSSFLLPFFPSFPDLTLKLVRGLDYYQHLVFEFVDNENLTTVLAGGRYDSLLTQLGGDGMKEIGAIGWAAGVERLELLVKTTPPIHYQKPLVPIIVVRSDSDSETSSTSASSTSSSSSSSLSEMERLEVFALNILERLRKSDGSAVSVISETYQDRTTGKQLARALKKGSKAAVIVGVEEMRKGKVQIKHFDSRKQVECSLGDIEKTLQGLLNTSFE
jgi:histidyl-tRNA synthetase